MILKMFTVHDAKVGAYLQPFFARSAGEATRSFAEAVNSADHQFAKHAADYSLFEVGDFDDELGVFTSLSAPRSLGNGVDFKVNQ